MLAGEEREINAGDKDFQVAVLEELIKGPQNPSLGATIPPDVQVLGVTVEEKGTAVVDFSRELLTSHWGGSMGEIMTVYSVVNTLSSLPGIEQVKFLVEGEEIETLTGHLDISEPVEPDWDLGKVSRPLLPSTCLLCTFGLFYSMAAISQIINPGRRA